MAASARPRLLSADRAAGVAKVVRPAYSSAISATTGTQPMPKPPELEGKHSDLPEDADLFALGLEDDSKLYRAKLIAGVLSVVALIAMLVTSLFRAPNPEWTALLAVVTGVLIVGMSGQVARHRADRRRRTDL
jgi:hypothetical protein